MYIRTEIQDPNKLYKALAFAGDFVRVEFRICAEFGTYKINKYQKCTSHPMYSIR